MLADAFDLKPSKTPKSASERDAILKGGLGFGRVFTEHMVQIRYAGGAWQRGELVPYGPITLDPAASVLHYGQAIFEGFKAYRQPDGSIATFRPEANGKRFAASARRLAMPELPVELFVGASDVLLRHEAAWVPSGAGESLYLRPLMIATEAALGVKPAKEYSFLLFGSPGQQSIESVGSMAVTEAMVDAFAVAGVISGAATSPAMTRTASNRRMRSLAFISYHHMEREPREDDHLHIHDIASRLSCPWLSRWFFQSQIR